MVVPIWVNSSTATIGCFADVANKAWDWFGTLAAAGELGVEESNHSSAPPPWRVWDALNRDLTPFLSRIQVGRALKLIDAAENNRELDPRVADDILRAVIVLNHAYLEDFLRTIALSSFPTAASAILDDVPLIMPDGKPLNKFSLKALAQHTGKSVQEVIYDSLETHMGQYSFSSPTKIVSLLESIGFSVQGQSERLRTIGVMIERRHQIVHRSDLVYGSKAGDVLALSEVNVQDVRRWTVDCFEFMLAIVDQMKAEDDRIRDYWKSEQSREP